MNTYLAKGLTGSFLIGLVTWLLLLYTHAGRPLACVNQSAYFPDSVRWTGGTQD
jgi:hypothetical protein